jgi:hypothetical protein
MRVARTCTLSLGSGRVVGILASGAGGDLSGEFAIGNCGLIMVFAQQLWV